MQYTDIALAAVLCSNSQVPAAETTTTLHLIDGKTPHRSLEFFYSLICKVGHNVTNTYNVYQAANGDRKSQRGGHNSSLHLYKRTYTPLVWCYLNPD